MYGIKIVLCDKILKKSYINNTVRGGIRFFVTRVIYCVFSEYKDKPFSN